LSRYKPAITTGKGTTVMRWNLLEIVAGIGALLHLGFAYQEMVGWGPAFVRRSAKAWMRDARADDAHVAWVRPLAFNVGAYNLVLAIGLIWVTMADPAMANALGRFFAFWLIVAAAAAACTKVWPAAVLQGVLGLLLGIAAFAR
jgi:uncharacterized membrane protein